MLITDKISPFNAPNYDVLKQTRRSDPRGFVVGARLDGAQSYVVHIGLTSIREVALEFSDRTGLVDVELLNSVERSFDGVVAEREVLRARVAELEDEVETHKRWVTQKLGLDKPPKPMGRPPKEASSV